MNYELLIDQRRKLKADKLINEDYISIWKLTENEAFFFYDTFFYKGKFECIQEISYKLPYIDLCDIHNIYFYNLRSHRNNWCDVFKINENYYIDYYGMYEINYLSFLSNKDEFKFESSYWYHLRPYINRTINQNYYKKIKLK